MGRRTHRGVKIVIPVGSVKQVSLEIVKTRNSWPFPLIEETGSRDQDIGLILDQDGLSEIQSQ